MTNRKYVLLLKLFNAKFLILKPNHFQHNTFQITLTMLIFRINKTYLIVSRNFFLSDISAGIRPSISFRALDLYWRLLNTGSDLLNVTLCCCPEPSNLITKHDAVGSCIYWNWFDVSLSGFRATKEVTAVLK